MAKHFFFVLVCIFLVPVESWAGSFTARIDKTVGILGDVFELTLSIQGSADGKPELPEIDDLVTASRGQSTNISLINGSLSRETSYSYALEPQKAGTYTIPSIALKVDGKELKTVPLTFTVKEENTSKKDIAQAGKEPPLTFMERSFSNESPYIGEPVVETITLYYRGRIDPSRVPSQPRGVRIFELEGEEHGREAVEGVAFDTVTVRRIIVPLAAGELSMPPFRLRVRIAVQDKRKRRRGLDPWLQMFNDPFGKKITRMVSTGAASLNVKDLPEANKPSEFSGISGDFRLTSKLSQKSLKVGETTTLTVTLAGEGLLDNVGELPWSSPEGIKAYPDQPEAREQARLTGVYSSKTYRFALVPTAAGTIDLGRLKLPIFNYKKNSYEVLEVPLGEILVEGDANTEVATPLVSSKPTTTPQNKVKALANDLVDIKRRLRVNASHSLEGGDYIVLSLMTGVPLLLCFGLFGMRLGERRKLKDPSFIRKKEALSVFEKSLQAVQDKLNEAAYQQASEQLYEAYRVFLGDKLSLQGRSLTAKEITAQLESLKVSEQSLLASQQFLSKLEALSYGAGQLSKQELQTMISEVETIVREVDQLC